MDPLVITVAPVGAEVNRSQTPYIPLTPEEIAEECYRAWNEGASIAHLHARDENGDPTQDPAVYARIIDLRDRGPISSSRYPRAGRSGDGGRAAAPVSLKPDMATLHRDGKLWRRHIHQLLERHEVFAQAMRKTASPEFELFDVGMIENQRRLWVKKIRPSGPLTS